MFIDYAGHLRNSHEYFGASAKKSYVLQTKLSVDEVKKRMLTCIQQKQNNDLKSFYNHFTRQYEGKLIGDVFRISQVIVGRRNSFAPLITGKIVNGKDRTAIEIKMELRSSAIQFMAIWICFTGFMFVLLWLVSTKQQKPVHSPPLFIIPLVMLVFGFYLTFSGFNKESQNSKEYLARLLEESSDSNNGKD